MDVGVIQRMVVVIPFMVFDELTRASQLTRDKPR
jgi:hypothetical protein